MHTDDTSTAATPSALAERLKTVYWIGGGSGSGKSTMARRLAAAHGMELYSTDDVMADHARRCVPEDCPALTTFVEMSMDDRWLGRSPTNMLETFHWFRGEGFGLILEDLVELPADTPVIVEGFRLLPHLVSPLVASAPTHAVWLLPTRQFRRAAFESRGTLWDIAGKTSDPPRALDNLLERDALFTDRLAAETEALGLAHIPVTVSLSEAELARRVTELFGL